MFHRLVFLLCFSNAFSWPLGATTLNMLELNPKKHPIPPGTPEFWTKLFISGFLVLAGGVFAGYLSFSFQCSIIAHFAPIGRLTLGLMGLDELHLRVLATSSEDVKQRRNAQKGKHSTVQTKWLDDDIDQT
jgi:hypothetical protein